MTVPRPKNATRLDILNGWKAIANYLGTNVRSVQRYERELGLPIHRLRGGSRSGVIATKAELDGWVKHGSVQAIANRVGADFLQVDCGIALTFSGIALATSNEGRRLRLTQKARRAYDTIVRLRENIAFDQEERDRLDARLQRLKSELETLGESF